MQQTNKDVLSTQFESYAKKNYSNQFGSWIDKYIDSTGAELHNLFPKIADSRVQSGDPIDQI